MAKYDAGSGVSGAMTGASIGSIFGPIGTATGGLLGGFAGLFGSKKKKKKLKQMSTMDPLQQELYTQRMAALRGEGPLAGLYNFDPNAANMNFESMIARPAYRQFQEKIVPEITGQFRGRNLMNSSYTGQALSNAGRDVQESLDAQRANYLYNREQDVLERKNRAIESSLGMQTFAYNRPSESKSTIDQILSALGPQAGEWFADFLKSKRNTTGSTIGGP